MGDSSTASGAYSFAIGASPTASGNYSTAMGYGTTVAGDYSLAAGKYMQLSSSADRSFAFGYSDSAVSIDTPDAFIIYSDNVGIGDTSPSAKLTASSTTEHLRLIYDEVNNQFASFTVASDGDMVIDLGTDTATTTFNENVYVAKTLWANNSYVGDLFFGNMFRITEATTTLATTTLDVLTINNASNTPLLYLVENGHIGIATTTPTNILTIGQGMGNAIADGWDVYSSEEYKTDIVYLEEQDYDDILEEIGDMDLATWRWRDEIGTVPESLGIIAEEAPEQVLGNDGKSVSLYDYASYALAGIKALNSEVEEMKALLNIVEDEEGSLVLAEEDETVIIDDNGQQIQLVLDEDGYVVVDKLKVGELEIAQGGQMILPEGPDEIIGIGKVATSSNFVIIENNKIATSSKIFVSFTSNLNGASWWVCDKISGELFKLCLSHDTEQALSFDYWIIGTRMATGMTTSSPSTVFSTTSSDENVESQEQSLNTDENFVELTPEEQLIELSPEEGGPAPAEEPEVSEEPTEPAEEPVEEVIDEEIIEETIEEPTAEEPIAEEIDSATTETDVQEPAPEEAPVVEEAPAPSEEPVATIIEE